MVARSNTLWYYPRMTYPAEQPQSITKTMTITVTVDAINNQSAVKIDSTPNTTSDDLWQAMKMVAVQMAAASEFIADPTVREQIGICANATKNLILGTEEAIKQVNDKKALMKKSVG